MNRRNFIKTTAAAGATSLLIPEIVCAAMPEMYESSANSGDSFSSGCTILFQGDSITDAGRDRSAENKPSEWAMLGRGYALFASAALMAKCPDKNLKIYNRGISGDRVQQLVNRWDTDCVSLNPSILSILIGVNDYWRTKDSSYQGNIESYLTDYRKLLTYTKAKLPDTKIIICEPFIIHGGTALDASWEPVFAGYRSVAGMMAEEFQTGFVPFQKIFNKALEKAPASYWGADGVHPSMAGAQLMAEAWVKVAQFEVGVRSFSAFKHKFVY
jgi:lysophospholipase L1-like esterase